MRTIASEGEGAFGAVGVIRKGGKGRGVKVCICRSVSIVVGMLGFCFFLNPRLQVQLLASPHLGCKDILQTRNFNSCLQLSLFGFDFIFHGIFSPKNSPPCSSVDKIPELNCHGPGFLSVLNIGSLNTPG